MISHMENQPSLLKNSVVDCESSICDYSGISAHE